MRKVLLPLLLGLTFVGTSLTVTPAAHADPDSVTVNAYASRVDVRKGRCSSAHIRAYGNWEHFDDATVRVVIRDPADRKFAEATFINRSGGFERAFRVCHAVAEGIYSAAVEVVAVDELGEEYVGRDTVLFRVHHIVPKKRSRIAERHGRVAGQGQYRFQADGRLYRDGRLYPGQRVWLIAKIGRGWYKIDRSRTGYRGRWRGRVGWYFKPNSTRWAFYYAGNDRTRRSVSDLFRFGSGRESAVASRVSELRSLVADR